MGGAASEVIQSATRRLVIVRQSGVSAVNDLQDLTDATYMTYPELPDLQHLRAVGVNPLVNPTDFPEAEYWRLPGGGRAALWTHKATSVFMALGSIAASDQRGVEHLDEQDENAIVGHLQDIVRSRRPQEVLVGPFDRIVRAFKHSSVLYRTFKGNIELFRHDGGHIVMGEPTAESKWMQLTVAAAEQHRTTVSRLQNGHVRKARKGIFSFRHESAPAGFEIDADRKLAVSAGRSAMITDAIRELANPNFAVAEAARNLVAAGHTFTFGELGGENSDEVLDFRTHMRASKFLQKLIIQLPDLAQGRYVLSMKQTSSIDSQFPGVRRKQLPAGRYAHQLVFDVPDLFAAISDDQLQAAVLTAVGKRLSLGHSPSDWLDEEQERERATDRLARGGLTTVEQERLSWAGPGASVVNTMGGLTPALRPWLAHAIKNEAERFANSAEFTSTRGQYQYRRAPFDLIPTVLIDQSEIRLRHAATRYQLLQRQPESQLSAIESAARTWGRDARQRTFVIATLPDHALHEAVAQSIAGALAAGIPVSPEGTAISAALTHGRMSPSTLRGAERLNLVDALHRVTDEHSRADRKYNDMLERDCEHTLPRALIDQALHAYGDSFKKMEDLAARLKTFDAAPVVAQVDVPEPEAIDLQHVANVLAALSRAHCLPAADVTRLRHVIPTFRIIRVDNFWLEFETTILLPRQDSVTPLAVGPVRGRVRVATTIPAADGRVLRVEAARVETKAEMGAMLHAEELCLRRLEPGDLLRPERIGLSLRETRRSGSYKMAQRYLVSQGMGPGAAGGLLTCPFQFVRRTVWELLHNVKPTTVGLSEQYVELLREAFLGASVPKHGPYHRADQTTQCFVDKLSEQGGEMDVHELRQAVATALGRRSVANPRDLSVYNEDGESCIFPKREAPRVPGRPGPPAAIIYLGSCPHCSDGILDLVAKVDEVPTGVLCSTCLRMATPDSPTFPDAYRGLPSFVAERSEESSAAANGEDS